MIVALRGKNRGSLFYRAVEISKYRSKRVECDGKHVLLVFSLSLSLRSYVIIQRT